MRAALAMAIACFSLGAIGAADEARAAIKKQTNIPAQNLSTALQTLARDRNLQVVFVSEEVNSLHTAGAIGELTADEALTKLLNGTELTYRYLDDRTITVAPTASIISAESQTPANTAERPSAKEAQKTASFWDQFRLARLDQGQTASDEPVGSSRAAANVDAGVPQSQKMIVLDEVVVTGTHIRGVTNPTAPLIVMDRAFIESTGYTTTTQLIESLPQNFALVNQSVTGGVLSGNSFSVVQGSSISLRGVGEGTTLTLVNGRRVAPGYDGSAVNISALPLAAIERVEVLTDGASALYGSDAVGGVVNFILRRDFQGAETQFSGGLADDMDELRLNQTLGHSWDSGNVVVSGEYYTRDMLLSTDRRFGIDASADPSQLQVGSLLPEENNFAVTLFGRQNFGSDLELFVDALYTDRDSENVAENVAPTTNRRNFIDSKQLSTAAGLARTFVSGWRAELSGGYGEDDTLLEFINPRSPTIGFGYAPILFQLTSAELKADGPLFDLAGGTVRLAAGAQWREESLSSRNSFRDPAGVVIIDDLFSRDREVSSVYTEVSVPLVGPANARPGLHGLELSLAARYDEYSDFGSSTDPRLGIAWKPSQGLTLRGSWGTSYLAPKLRDFDVAFNSAFALDDTLNLGGTNGLHLIQVSGAAPESLGPQESENFSIGLDWSPDFLPGSRFAVNYFDIEYTNRVDSIIALEPSTLLATPSAYEGLLIFDPTEAQVLEVIASGEAGGFPFEAYNGDFTPNANFQPGDVDLIIDARRRNIGVVKTSGVDLSASYDFSAFGGSMRVALDGAWTDDLVKQLTATSAPLHQVDTFANPTRWRLRGQVGLRRAAWAMNAFVHHRNSYTDNRFPPFVEIGSYTTVDVNVGYTFNESAGALSNTSIRLSAINAFDKDPPATRVRAVVGLFDLGFDPANASPLGRLIALDVTKRW